MLVKLSATTEGPTATGGASPVIGGRDDLRAISAKRWVPPSVVRRDALTQENRNELTFRKVRGILNKLTPEKFDKLSDDLKRLCHNSETTRKGVIHLIFEKAIEEPKYSSMYAQLCLRLCEEGCIASTKEQCPFRRELLRCCRNQFESRTQKQTDRRKSLGNMKFIGELCNLGILWVKPLYDCIETLLTEIRKLQPYAVVENIEHVCQVLRTCGHTLDTVEAKALMGQYFDQMAKLAKDPSLPMRIKFMLRDVIELRNNKWKPRQSLSNEGPLPITQINEDNMPFMRGDRIQQQPPDRFGSQFKLRSNDFITNLSSTLPILQPDKFNQNGFQSGFRDRGPQRQNHHQQSYYQQNRYNSMHNNNNSNNNSGSKDLAPRFIKRMMTAHEQSSANLDQVSLRPPADSILVKPPNLKQTSQFFPAKTQGPEITPNSLKLQPPIQTTKEVPLLIKQVTNDRGKPSKKDKANTKEELLKKSGSIADEIIEGTLNVDEGVRNFSQLKIPDRLVPECLHAIMARTHEKLTDADRETMISLMCSLKKEDVITSTNFNEAFRLLLKSIGDLETTVPNIHNLVASIAASAVSNNLLTISQIGEHTAEGAHYPLLLNTLESLSKTMDQQHLIDLFNESKVSLLSSLCEADRTKERLCEILEKRGLVFLEPMLGLEAQMWAALETEPTAQSLCKTLKEVNPSYYKSSSFIIALMTVCLKYVTQEVKAEKEPTTNGTGGGGGDKVLQEEKAMLKKFQGVLQSYLQHDRNLQVVAVNALQVFCYSMDFPKGMLLRWFINLYDLEIVEEEAFEMWKEDISDVYPGKGDALFQVNQWLTWLATASSEDEDDGEN